MTTPTAALLLDFDGTCYTGDLPYHSYARHICDHLPGPAATELIGWMRRFLEELSPAERSEFPVVLHGAEDGYQAISGLAAAAGVGVAERTAAYRRSREDLAMSSFALDPVAGLPELLTEWGSDVVVVLATNAPEIGVREVLDAVDLLPHIDRIITDADKPRSMPGLLTSMVSEIGGSSDHLLAVGDRWAADLADAARMGCGTAFVDRFGRGDGNPTWRAAELSTMVGNLGDWARKRLG